MVAEIRQRLKSEGPFVAVHLSVAMEGAGGEGRTGCATLWQPRYSAFQAASGVATEHAARARDKITAELAVLTPRRLRRFLGSWGSAMCERLMWGFRFEGGSHLVNLFQKVVQSTVVRTYRASPNKSLQCELRYKN